MKRTLFFIAGTLSTALGIVGIFVPILPTTPFLLLAAICYMRSSQRMYRWLLENKLLGKYIKNYLQGKRMSLGAKIATVALLWACIGLSIWLASETIWLKIVLALVAIGVTAHLLLIKTTKSQIS